MKPKSHGIVTLEILALAYGNGFVGKVVASENQELIGLKAFCDYTAPGEKVTGELIEEKRKFFKLRTERIENHSPARQTPPCPYFGSCGGCTMQHLQYAEQRKLKASMVSSLLKMHANIDVPVLWHESALPEFNYRRRVIFHTDRAGKLGFYYPHSWRLQPIEKCLIVTDAINAALPEVETIVGAFEATFGDVVIEECNGKIYVELRTRPKIKSIQAEDFRALCHDLSSVASVVTIAHRGKQEMMFLDGKQVSNIEYPVGHFSQVNEKGNQILQKLVIDGCKDASEITELYSGAGNFSFPLAALDKKVTAVEVDGALVTYANTLVKEKNLQERLQFIERSTEKYVRKVPLLKTVVLDPPRGGAQEAVENCKPEVTKTIVYVSCSAATFARDVKILVAKGYAIDKVILVDMFPQGHHVELVGVLNFQ